MNCKIGDKVRFLNATGGGIVVRFMDKNMVAIQDEDGFEIPVQTSEIVVINEKNDNIFLSDSYYRPSDEGAEQHEKHSGSNDDEDEDEDDEDYDFYIPQRSNEEDIDPSTNNYNVLLGFVPFNKQNPDKADLDIFVINDSDYRIAYSLGKWTDKEMLQPIGAGVMEPDSKERICTLPREDFSKLQVMNMSVVYFKNRDFVPIIPDQVNIELNPLKFVKANSFRSNDYFDENAAIFVVSTSKQSAKPSISTKEVESMLKQKGDYVPIKTKKPTPELEEVDLHIEEILDNYQSLSNGEIVEAQMARFTTALEGAIRAKTKRIVFIHGIGNGKLKHELRKTLDQKYPKLRYQDASFKDYGYGATLVLLR